MIRRVQGSPGGPEPRALTVSEQLDRLRYLMPKLDAEPIRDGLWRVHATPMMSIKDGPIVRSVLAEGPTRDAAIAEAFREYTEGSPRLVLGHPDSPRYVEAAWNGGGWNFTAGSPTVALEWAHRAIELGVAEERTIGIAPNMSAPVTVGTVAVAHRSERPKGEVDRLLDRAFATDQMRGGHDRALELYARAFTMFRAEVTTDHAAVFRAARLDPVRVNASENQALFARALRISGLSADPDIQSTAKKLFNRTGLATAHAADAMAREGRPGAFEQYGLAFVFADLAAGLDAGYAAAHYNKAAFVLKMGAGDPAAVEEGLDLLALALSAGGEVDLAKHARESDPDFNGVRDHPRFRALVGL